MPTWKQIYYNPSFKKKLFIREKIILAVREYFHNENFHEIETPLLIPSVIPESYLESFTTDLINRYGRRKKMFLAAKQIKLPIMIFLKKLLLKFQ